MAAVRYQDAKRLRDLWDHILRGGFPDLGKPHAKAGYRYAIGHAVYENGRIDIWRENLGHDKLVAQFRARAMVDVWVSHRTSHGSFDDPTPPLNRALARSKAWEKADEQMLRPYQTAQEFNAAQDGFYPISPGYKLVVVAARPANEQETGEQVAVATPPAKTLPTVLMLHSATKDWLANLDRRLAVKEIGDAYTARAESFIDHFCCIVDDQQVYTIKKPELTAIRQAVQHCPKKNGKPRSRETTRTELGMVKDFFQWLSDSEHWRPPTDWRRWLKADHRNAHHDDDAEADKSKRIDTYSIPELTKVYAVAGKALRTWICCALNFAWAQTEISTARRKHWKSGKRRVARFRGKRSPTAKPVPGRWVAWPETWKLTTDRMTRTPTDVGVNPDGRAFLTKAGKALVRYIRPPGKKRRREDAIAEAWAAACEIADVRNRGFGLLRHTGINLIKRVAKPRAGAHASSRQIAATAEEIADLYCQHAPETMTEDHYLNADWRGLFRALRRMRRKLDPMFEAGAAAKAKRLRVTKESGAIATCTA